MNQITFSGLACTLIFSLAPLTTHAQDKTNTETTAYAKKADRVALVGFGNQKTGGNGTVKFFNATKGFGLISDVTGMDELLEEIAVICGGPTTGCTFEIIDWLNDVLHGTHSGSESTDGWNDLFRGSGALPGLIDEINEGDDVRFNTEVDQNEFGAPKTDKKSKVKFKAGSDLAGKVN
ncbi:hypothetical protein OAG56_03090 [Mariniblastus sp.]|jgi:cold shock CspA family protein|nr:hypothetical protein [Mariniblastus sp.]MDB4756333.1 hypothetical protein [Mariniblastus sp.]